MQPKATNLSPAIASAVSAAIASVLGGAPTPTTSMAMSSSTTPSATASVVSQDSREFFARSLQSDSVDTEKSVELNSESVQPHPPMITSVISQISSSSSSFPSSSSISFTPISTAASSTVEQTTEPSPANTDATSSPLQSPTPTPSSAQKMAELDSSEGTTTSVIKGTATADVSNDSNNGPSTISVVLIIVCSLFALLAFSFACCIFCGPPCELPRILGGRKRDPEDEMEQYA